MQLPFFLISRMKNKMKKISLFISALGLASAASAAVMVEESSQTARVYDGITVSQAQCAAEKYIKNPEGSHTGVATKMTCQPSVSCSSNLVFTVSTGDIMVLPSSSTTTVSSGSQIPVQGDPITGSVSIPSTSSGYPIPPAHSDPTTGSILIPGTIYMSSEGYDSSTLCTFAGATVKSYLPLNNEQCPEPVPGADPVICAIAFTSLDSKFTVEANNKLKIEITTKPSDYQTNAFWEKIDAAVESCTATN
jgi:hypothetical protein